MLSPFDELFEESNKKYFYYYRDHLLNLYGPTLVHEEGQSGMLLEPVKAIDLLTDEENMSRSSSPGSFRRAAKRTSDHELRHKID